MGSTPAVDRRAAALEWAASARAARAGVREQLASGAVRLPDVLGSADEDPLVGTVRLLWVLESLPGARKTDTRRALDRLGIRGDVALAALDAEDRAAVLAEFAPGVGS